MTRAPYRGLFSLVAAVVLAVASATGAGGAPDVRLRVSHRATAGTVSVRLLGRGVGEFQALSLDLRTPQGATAGDCSEASRQTSKTAVCSQPTPGIVRLGLFGPTEDALIDGELVRLTLSLPHNLDRGRYPISAIVRFARADGSEFEVGPIATILRVAATRQRSGR
jgi:hypothetical protein